MNEEKVKNCVEIRTLPKINIEIKENRSVGATPVMIGVIKYNTRSDPEQIYDEKLAQTAFNKTLMDGQNVFCNVQHGEKRLVGSTKSGTLRLFNKPDGLYFELDQIDTTDSKDTFTLVGLKILNGVSFEFEDIKSDWGFDAKNQRQTRIIREQKLRQISIGVLRPYYQENVSTVISNATDGGKDDREDDGVIDAGEARQLKKQQLNNITKSTEIDFDGLLLSAALK